MSNELEEGLTASSESTPTPADQATNAVAVSPSKEVTLLNKTHVRESLQILRTNIQFSAADSEICAVAVASPEPGAGKSFTASNLAATFASSGQKTLLIDCDLRRPTIHRQVGISNQRGLSNYLVGAVDLAEVVQDYSGLPMLKVIPSGPVPPNPPQLFESAQFDSMLAEARDAFDMIVLDTPPLNLVADALVLARKVDGTLLVCREGQTTYKDIREATEHLRQAKVRVLGTVLNCAKSRNGKSHYYTDD